MTSQFQRRNTWEPIAMILAWFLVFYAANWIILLNLGHLLGSLNRAWVLLALILVGALAGYGANKAGVSRHSLVAASILPILAGLVWWPMAHATSEYPEFFFLGLIPMVHSLVAAPAAIATYAITPGRTGSDKAEPLERSHAEE